MNQYTLRIWAKAGLHEEEDEIELDERPTQSAAEELYHDHIGDLVETGFELFDWQSNPVDFARDENIYSDQELRKAQMTETEFDIDVANIIERLMIARNRFRKGHKGNATQALKTTMTFIELTLKKMHPQFSHREIQEMIKAGEL